MTNLERAILDSVDFKILEAKIAEIDPNILATALADKIISFTSPNAKGYTAWHGTISTIMREATTLAKEQATQRIEEDIRKQIMGA